MRWNGELPNTAANARKGNDNGRGTEGTVQREWRTDESGTDRMANGLPESIHSIAPDSQGIRMEGSDIEQICRGGGTTDIS